MKKFQTEFIKPVEQVSEEKYYDMLECLPPIRMELNAFLVGEPVDHTKEDGAYVERYSLYYEKGGQHFYGGLATLKDFDTFVIPNENDNA